VQAAGLEERYDLVTCSNVLAHIHDLGDVSNAVRRLLKPEGLFVVEVHDGELLERQNQFDTIYHEHLTYFTEETLRGFLERRGFRFVLCERTSMHGGALRCLVRKASSSDPVTTNSVGRTVRAASADFIGPMIEKCRLELERLYEANGPLAGYGAAGRSQMFINFTTSGRLFDRVYDDSPFRQRRFIAGTDIPISKFEGESGDCCIILAWNYADDIHRKIRNQYETVVTMLPAFRVW
jgi:hypothetical protein